MRGKDEKEGENWNSEIERERERVWQREGRGLLEKEVMIRERMEG